MAYAQSAWAPSSPTKIKMLNPDFQDESPLGTQLGGGGSGGGGKGGLKFKMGGGSSPLDPYGSGLEGLNDLNQFPIPTYSQDPFYY
ncbi:MAG: hypothetical protein QF535_16865, partial [Anaerolineales bacterium]|nr:hypothetical protein [Anaerolineales bacterium]